MSSYLCSTELLKVQNRMICTFRNSVLFDQVVNNACRNSWNHNSKRFTLSGAPFDIKEKWFALKGEQETDIHLQFALNEASETIIRFYLNKTELQKLMFTMFFTFAKMVLMQIPYNRMLKHEASQIVTDIIKNFSYQ